MNMTRSTILAALALSAAVTFANVPEVTSVTMTQAPTRVVTIAYTLTEAPAVVTLDVQTNANTSAGDDDPGWISIGGEAVCNAKGDVWKKVDIGSRTITWRPDLSWPDHKIANGGARAVVTAWATNNTPDYMVVDVSAGAEPNSQRYYTSTNFLPGGLLGNDDYRTTKLVMRKIMAKDVEWAMGSTATETQRTAGNEDAHLVTLPNNYYIGVFPITQSQFKSVATNSASVGFFSTERSMRAMEEVCFNEIRTTHNVNLGQNAACAAGPITAAPASDSFLGLLNRKTGLDFDLPSEAQWEFAARAGHGNGYWGNGTAIKNTDSDANLSLLGRYRGNGGRTDMSNGAPITSSTAIVGTYLPNDWGLYDVFGNVREVCLDWYEADITGNGGRVNINPANPAQTLSGTTGDKRVARGGSFYADAGGCRPAARSDLDPSARGFNNGFRVICTAGLE